MRRIASLVLTFGLAACVLPLALRTEHVVTGRPGTPFAGAVAISMEGQPPPGDVEEVAIVSATGAGDRASLHDVLGALQAEAARLGADAVIRVRYDRGAAQATATGVAVRSRSGGPG